MNSVLPELDPRFDLVLERIVDVAPELVWAAWTTPEHLLHWFTPAPWRTVECEIDLRPGGKFSTVMRSPEGQDFPNAGCYLEVVPEHKLVWTNVLQPGFRPGLFANSNTCGDFAFTAIINLETHEKGTKYTAIVLHNNEEDCKKHADMGFADGWGKALEQLVAYMKTQVQ